MMKKDKLKAIEIANKRLLGESFEEGEKLSNQMDRLKHIKDTVLPPPPPEDIDECEGLKNNIREYIEEMRQSIEEERGYFHTEDDLEGLSDIDSFYVGERSGNIEKMVEVAEKLEQILNS